MAYTNLTGRNFQKAHLALMGKVRQVPYCSDKTKATRGRGKVALVRDCSDKTKVVEAFAVAVVAVGIILGVALLLGAVSCGMARGAGWECGNYASAPAWND
jgi:hypothetical protein